MELPNPKSPCLNLAGCDVLHHFVTGLLQTPCCCVKLPPNYQSRSRRESFSATRHCLPCPPTLKEVPRLRDIICKFHCRCQPGLRLANVLWSSGQQALLLLFRILNLKLFLVANWIFCSTLKHFLTKQRKDSVQENSCTAGNNLQRSTVSER